MKIRVKTLKGTHFEIEVKSHDTVADVKKNIETAKGFDVYPASQQLLIYQGRFLNDESTLEENKVFEKAVLVLMPNKKRAASSGAATVSVEPSTTSNQPPSNAPLSTRRVRATRRTSSTFLPPQSAPEPLPVSSRTPASSVRGVTDTSDQATSNIVSRSNMEATVQRFLDMGCGSWDRDTIIRALRAARNNPGVAIDFLCSGVPKQVQIPPISQPPGSGQLVKPSTEATQPAAVTSSGPNTNPLDLFPQGLPTQRSTCNPQRFFSPLIPQLQALPAMLRENPHIWLRMLREARKKNPQLLRLMRENRAEFLHLVNQHVIEGRRNVSRGCAEAMPGTVILTNDEKEALKRLEALGFDRHLVLEAYLACDKNEELAANYLLDRMNELNDEVD